MNTSKDDKSLPLSIGSTLYKMAQIGSWSLLYKVELAKKICDNERRQNEWNLEVKYYEKQPM